MAPNLQKFCGRLVRQGLFQPKDLESIYRQWRLAAPKERDNVRSFAQFIVLRSRVGIEQLTPFLNGPPAAGTSNTDRSTTSADTEVDVELVKIPDPRRIGRRDLIGFAIGMLVGAFVAVGIMILVRR
ncbi:MAG: hypothetical protein ACJ8C4_02345 [Gemmataceae bacterium]